MTAEGDFGERFISLANETRQEGVDLLGINLATLLPKGEGRPLDRLISFVGAAIGVELDEKQEELARKAFARAWRTATASGQIPEPFNACDFPGLIAFTLRQQGFLPAAEPATGAGSAGALVPTAELASAPARGESAQLERSLKPPQFILEFSSESRPGTKQSHEYQDERFIDPSKGLAMVFDGVSLPSHGKEAAVAAKDYLIQAWQLTAPQDPQVMETGMRDILAETSKNVVATGGATTAVVARFFPKDDQVTAVIGWVGDSRAYVFRAKDGRLEKLTEDHDPIWANLKDNEFPLEQRDRMREILTGVPHYVFTREADGQLSPDPKAEQEFADRLLKAGIIAESDYDRFQLYEFARTRTAVSQYLGGRGTCQPAVLTAQLHEGDKMILVTDGVYKAFTPATLEEFIGETKEDLVKALVEEVIKNEKDTDDMTAAVVEVKKRTGAYFIRPEINRHWLADLSSEAIARYGESLKAKGLTITPVASGNWLLADGIAYRYHNGEEGRVSTNLEQLGMQQRIDYVGNYARQGGIVAFINEQGELFLGRDSEENLQALQAAGYEEDPRANVPLSHEEEVIDEKTRAQFFAVIRFDIAESPVAWPIYRAIVNRSGYAAAEQTFLQIIVFQKRNSIPTLEEAIERFDREV